MPRLLSAHPQCTWCWLQFSPTPAPISLPTSQHIYGKHCLYGLAGAHQHSRGRVLILAVAEDKQPNPNQLSGANPAVLIRHAVHPAVGVRSSKPQGKGRNCIRNGMLVRIGLYVYQALGTWDISNAGQRDIQPLQMQLLESPPFGSIIVHLAFWNEQVVNTHSVLAKISQGHCCSWTPVNFPVIFFHLKNLSFLESSTKNSQFIFMWIFCFQLHFSADMGS